VWDLCCFYVKKLFSIDYSYVAQSISNYWHICKKFVELMNKEHIPELSYYLNGNCPKNSTNQNKSLDQSIPSILYKIILEKSFKYIVILIAKSLWIINDSINLLNASLNNLWNETSGIGQT